MTKVVIVGAGFGGLQCARALHRSALDVVLLDRNNYHLFTPLLYQVASSLLNPSDIAYPVRTVFGTKSNVRFRTADVIGVDLERRVVRTATGPEEVWDRLVVATGAEINFFGQDRIAVVSRSLTDLSSALKLRRHVLTCFEAAAATSDTDERRHWLTFVIVGAGPTGVEYAGALWELAALAVRRDYRQLGLSDIRIVLVEGVEQVLPMFAPSLGQYARRVLETRGVEVRLGVLVRDADRECVRLSDGEEIAARTVVWAAGVRPGRLTRELGAPLTKSGRLAVDGNLRLEGYEHVYAVGDAAGAREDGTELPMLAPPAMQQGRHVARQLLRDRRGRPPRAFRYWDKGTMATIGRNAGVCQIGRLKLKGFPGWVAWLAVHIYFLIGFRNRIAVLLRWAWDYIFYDRPIRFVIGDSAIEEGRSAI